MTNHFPSSQASGTSAQVPAARLRKPTVKDPRLVIGILLVALSVWIGTWAVGNAKQLDIAYVAANPLVPGQPIKASDLRPVELNLAGQSSHYLRKGIEAGETVIAVRAIGAGEVIPVDALTSQDSVNSRIVALPIAEDLSKTISVGSQVDLWHIPKANSGEETAPREVAKGLYVSEIPDSGGAFSVSSGRIVHVVVPVAGVPDVLAALKEDGTLTLLSIPGGRS